MTRLILPSVPTRPRGWVPPGQHEYEAFLRDQRRREQDRWSRIRDPRIRDPRVQLPLQCAAWSLLASGNGAGTNAATTGAMNCVGADVIVIMSAHYTGGSLTFSDSSSNTWTTVTQQAGAADTSVKLDMAYCLAPTTGATQTFTFTAAATFIGVVAMAFSQGSAPTFVTRVGAAYSAGSVLQAGSIGNANDLVVSGISFGSTAPNATLAINSSFSTIVQQNYNAGANIGVAGAWKQVSGAVNPQWSWTGSTDAGAINISFTGTGAGSSSWGPLLGMGLNRLVVNQ